MTMDIVFYGCLALIFLVLVTYCWLQDKDIEILQLQIDFLKSQMGGKK